MKTAQENLADVKKVLNIYICPRHEELLLNSNGKSFYIYSFEFFGVGQGTYPNNLLTDGVKYQEYLGEGNIAFARDGTGGYFTLKNNGSKEVLFISDSEEYVYAADVKLFFEGFEALDTAIAKFEEQKFKTNPDYDIYEDDEGCEFVDGLYRKVMEYINLKRDNLGF